MKAVLEFNLPDDQHEFNNAANGYKWHLAMWELDQHLRTHTKYASDATSTDKVEALYETRDKLWSIMSEHNLSFDQ